MSRTDPLLLDLGEHEPAGRAALVARWLHLTRVVLPAMARERDWPISLDHCFMRVCLDAALGAPWALAIPRPAIRHMSDDQLTAAVGVAETLAARPDTLDALNGASLRGRAARRRTLTRAGKCPMPLAG